jgi:FKBP-type peptidyl-prolyl cis-trans isomerase
MIHGCRWLTGVFGLSVLTLTSGCEGLKDLPTGPQDAVATAPAPPPDEEPIKTADLKPKKAPLPKLPAGAGEMDADAPEELTPTNTGLYYRILRKSDGRKPKATESVVAHYRGTLDDGSQFDSSYDKGKPIPFGLNQVIKGWTEGLQLIGEGGMIELEIPYQLGYGPNGSPPRIPGKATLHFIVELKEIQ